MKRQNSQLRILSLILSVFIFIFSAQVHASGAKRPDIGTEAAATDAPSLTENATGSAEVGDGSSVATANASAYAHIDPENAVPKAMLNKALTYFDKNKSIIKNQEYVVVIDYKQHNTKERFFLIDMQSGKVEKYLVAHGKGSDPSGTGYAKKFSNTDMSLMTSLGFFITAETYYGSNGFSLRMDGKSPTNSNARARAIVIHGADYVNQGSVGRSWGCPALEMRYFEDVIERVKGGALVYAE